jgi:hypothetical protein
LFESAGGVAAYIRSTHGHEKTKAFVRVPCVTFLPKIQATPMIPWFSPEP